MFSSKTGTLTEEPAHSAESSSSPPVMAEQATPQRKYNIFSWFLGKKNSAQTSNAATQQASACSSVAEPPSENQFPIWSPEDKAAFQAISVGSDFREAIDKLVSTMDGWIHTYSKGWYHSQKELLDNLMSPASEGLEVINGKLPLASGDAWKQLIEEKRKITESNLGSLEIKDSLRMYLQTAYNLRKPKKGQIERVKIPNKNKYIEGFANGYRYFWFQCAYHIITNCLIRIHKMTKEELSDGKGKLYIYALLKMKAKELESFLLSDDDRQKLLTDFDKVILSLKSTCGIDDHFVLTEKEILASTVVSHQIMLKYLPLIDLKREFDASPLYAQFVHVRPAILIQFAQLIDYVYNEVSKVVTSKKSIFQYYSASNKDELNSILSILNNKRKEIATVMAFQERLHLSYGHYDIIECLHTFVDNKAAKLLPTHLFFNFETNQTFRVVNFDEQDPEAPKVVPVSEQGHWRRDYVLQHAGKEFHETTPVPNKYVTLWLDEQVRIEKGITYENQDNVIPTEMVRIVSVKNLDKHNIFLMSETPEENYLQDDKYHDAYLFISSEPPKLYHSVDQKLRELKIMFSNQFFNDLVDSVNSKRGSGSLQKSVKKLFQDSASSVSVKKELEFEPIQHLIDKNRLPYFWKIINTNAGHTHLQFDRLTFPAVVISSIFQNSQSSAAASYNDQLVGNGFVSDLKDNSNELYNFFISQTKERKDFLDINQALKSRNLAILLRQVEAKIEILDLYSANTNSLFKGPEGACANFLFLINALKRIVPASKKEIESATAAMKKSKNSAHVLAFKEYITLATQAREDFINKAKSILSFWIEEVKNIYPLPKKPKDITEFNILLKDALTALDDKPMLDYFYGRVFGAVVFPEGIRLQIDERRSNPFLAHGVWKHY